MWVHEKAVEAEDERLREAARRRAARYEESGDWRFPEEQDLPALPQLDQVTGWSKADPAQVPHNPDRALFGGWRLKDWKKRKRAKGP
jgi:hypothetical protein